ncbi:MAG: NPCBM/NEW2 domain-containing protein [Pontiellaceae bacterium]|nr:NPCBM/NEW2 domain-containing protein [Pontiellaceae bacterium]MBN2783430.1 NPCBM/NEW2 domain-containing protein [Pontiellaceae bacterium]
MKKIDRMCVVAILALAGFSLSAPAEPDAASCHAWAETPPMGWNSWDIFGTTITEKQAREQADAMAKYLLPAGYDVLTVDIQWYEPNAAGHVYKPGAPLEMDAYGRLLPANNRFPSAEDGKGFKLLADYVHSRGLRFGIHIMRGIPRQAVQQNTPVLGTELHAQDVAVTDSTCPWNPDMYGVDATTPGGQAYYDSIIALYASWGVDYIKCDDISRPYDAVQQAEIEALRKAIDKCGRPIVLSLSPGATPLTAGPHVMEHANLWRITDDFWDRWGLLLAMFERVHAWEPYRGPGHWPDADMIPLGMVEFGRPTKFTPDEQYTLMTLWSIARSPLIFGGDMTKLDDFTLRLLTNPEVLAVNQNSTNNRQVSRNNNLIVWAADVPGSPDKYVALFNAQSRGDSLDFADADYASPSIAGKGNYQDISLDITGGKVLALFVRDAGDGNSWDHAVWKDPVLKGSEGTLKLPDLKWRFAEAGWGSVNVNRTCDGKPLTWKGNPISGIGTHANSIIIYELPEGYETFSATGIMTEGGSVMFGVLVDEAGGKIADVSDVSVDFAVLGIRGPARVKDLWSGADLGTFQQSFGQSLPLHGAGLYRVSPAE